MKNLFKLLVVVIVVMGAMVVMNSGADGNNLKKNSASDVQPAKVAVEAAKTPVIEVKTETKIPIVMYHYVREVDKVKDPLGWNLSIRPPDFEKQMAWLKEKGYVTVQLKDLLEGKAPKNAIVLSFDDGLEDFYTTALPILQKYGFVASNAVITGMVGAHEHMSEEQIKGAIAAGIEITSHTVAHLDLATLNEAAVRKQVVDSKTYLKDKFGLDVSGFVYPSGKYNEMVVKVLAQEGYKIALTTAYGEADLVKNKMLLLPRIRIDNRDGFSGFVKKLEAAYSTRHTP